MSLQLLHLLLSRLGYVQDSGPATTENPVTKPPILYQGQHVVPEPGLKLVLTHVECISLAENSTDRRAIVRNSRCAYEIFRPFFAEHVNTYEAMRVILLDAGRRVRGVLTIGQGGVSETTADHRILFGAALKTLSTGIILAHNHPSGRLMPSAKDREWTRKVKEIGELHDIPLEDHLILTDRGYLSMADEGLL